MILKKISPTQYFYEVNLSYLCLWKLKPQSFYIVSIICILLNIINAFKERLANISFCLSGCLSPSLSAKPQQCPEGFSKLIVFRFWTFAYHILHSILSWCVTFILLHLPPAPQHSIFYLRWLYGLSNTIYGTLGVESKICVDEVFETFAWKPIIICHLSVFSWCSFPSSTQLNSWTVLVSGFF